MKLRCPNCKDVREFFGRQSCRGTISVRVNDSGRFVGNDTECGCPNTEGLDFDDPEGPFACVRCGAGAVESVSPRRLQLIQKFARLRGDDARYDAENCTSHEEEYARLAGQLAERMSDEELAAAVDELEAAADPRGEDEETP